MGPISIRVPVLRETTDKISTIIITTTGTGKGIAGLIIIDTTTVKIIIIGLTVIIRMEVTIIISIRVKTNIILRITQIRLGKKAGRISQGATLIRQRIPQRLKSRAWSLLPRKRRMKSDY